MTPTTKIYVVLQPHSNTNPSPKYRVVDADIWQHYVNKGQGAMCPVESSHDDHASAQAAADKLNGRTA